MTKGKLLEILFTEDERRSIDTAVPVAWANNMRDHELRPYYFVMNYNNNSLGELVNLAELFMDKFVALRGKLSDGVEESGEIFHAFCVIEEALKKL